MEEQPSKRRGRPRKHLDVPVPVEEGADASDLNDGIGQASGDGTPAQAIPEGKVDQLAMSWADFQERIKQMTLGKHRTEIRVAYHPQPEAEIISGNWNVRVEVGDIGFALSDGVKQGI